MGIRFTGRSVAPSSVAALLLATTAVGVVLLRSEVIEPNSCEAWGHVTLHEGHNEQSPLPASPMEVDNYRRALERRRFRVGPGTVAKTKRFATDGALDEKDLKRSDEAALLTEVPPAEAVRDRQEHDRVCRRLREMWANALGLFERERFGDCQRLCESIMSIDPQSPYALTLWIAARRARHAKASADRISTYRTKWQGLSQEARDLAIIQADLIEFPRVDRWRNVVSCGGKGCSFVFDPTVDADQEVRRRLAGTTLASVDWNEKALDEALRFLRINTGTNIIVMKAVDDVMPPEERILNLSLTNIAALSALNLAVSGLEGLACVIEDGIVKITTIEQARKRKTVEFYEVRDLTAPPEPNGEINLHPSSCVDPDLWRFDEEKDDVEWNETLEADRLIKLIRTTVDPTSWNEDPDNTIFHTSGRLIVCQSRWNHHEIYRLLSDLRQSATTKPRADCDDAASGAVTRPVRTTVESLSMPIAVDPYRGSDPWKKEQHSAAGGIASLDDVLNGSPYDISAILDNGGHRPPVWPVQTVPTPEPPSSPAWCGGRLLDLRRQPLAIETVRVVPADGDVRDWQQRVLLGLPDPGATISGNRFTVVVPTDRAFHLALQIHSRDWWLLEDVRAGCTGLVIEVPFEAVVEKSATNSSNTSPESSRREDGVTFGRAPAGVELPGRGTFAPPFDDFGVPGNSLLPGTDNVRGAFYRLNGDIRARTENVFDKTLSETPRLGDFKDPVSAETAPRDPECLRTRAWDEATGEEFYCWNLTPRSVDAAREESSARYNTTNPFGVPMGSARFRFPAGGIVGEIGSLQSAGGQAWR